MSDVAVLAQDKAYVQKIVERGYAVPAEAASLEFALALLSNLASTDAVLRDELTYMLLANAFSQPGILSVEELSTLLKVLLDQQHLFAGIGDVGNDTVFMRSFSLLIIAAILYYDSRKPQLPVDEIYDAYDALMRYANKERDWRGYVASKGWAHAMAHLADALEESALHPSTSVEQQKAILEVVRELAYIGTPLYHEEDMRLANVAYKIIVSKKLPEQYVEQWVERCTLIRGKKDQRGYVREGNGRNFLRSLYFLLLWNTMSFGITDKVLSLLKAYNQSFINQQ